MLEMGSNTLQQVEKFKYLGVIFTSDERYNKQIDTQICKANTFLRELHRSVVTKRELSNTAKLSVFRLVFVPILIYGHEFWVETERVLSQVQAAEIGILRRVHGVTLCDKVRSFEIRKALNAEPLLRIAISQLCWFRYVPECFRKDRRSKFYWLHPCTGKRARSRPTTRWSDYISDLAWFHLGMEPAELSEILVDREVLRVLLELLSLRPSPGERLT